MTYQIDPLNERAHEVLPGLVWKYSNRVLFLLTHRCPSGCAFCFREKLYDKESQRASNENVVEFIKQNSTIHEVIFSGGEPLTCSDDVVTIISELAHSQVKRFRIHTRLPITFPLNVDIAMLTPLPRLIHQPIYLTLHVNHPAELKKAEVKNTIHELRKAGYILLSHSVFLKGINDSVEILSELFEDLVDLGVKPYYIFHCDHMKHTERYEVNISTEREIMTELRRKVTGIAYPLHVIDSSSGKGKIPVPTMNWKVDASRYSDFDDDWLDVFPIKKGRT